MRYFKWIISFLLILIIIFIVISLKPEENVVTNEKKSKDETLSFDSQTVENVNFHDIYISKNGDYYIFTANITNLTADPLNINNVAIEVRDSNKVIANLIGYFGGYLNGDETKNIVVKTKENLSKAKVINFNLQEND